MRGNFSNTEKFIHKATERHGDRYDYSQVEYIGHCCKIVIICRQHGSFLQEPRKHLSGQGCQRCSGLHNKRKRHVPLNDLETKFLIENYGKMNFNVISRTLNRGKKILVAKLRQLKVPIKQVREKKIYKDIKVSYFNALKKGAGIRATKTLCFDITIEDIWNQYITQDKKCALSGVDVLFSLEDKLKTASVDRKDSDLGYTKENIQIVHKDVNYLKMDLSEKRLFDLCKMIFLHRKKDFNWKKIEMVWNIWHDTEFPVLVDSDEPPVVYNCSPEAIFGN
jgi:hypothetical protein